MAFAILVAALGCALIVESAVLYYRVRSSLLPDVDDRAFTRRQVSLARRATRTGVLPEDIELHELSRQFARHAGHNIPLRLPYVALRLSGAFVVICAIGLVVEQSIGRAGVFAAVGGLVAQAFLADRTIRGSKRLLGRD